VECGGIVINARDITDRKVAEDTIRSSLEEKEILLKEIHHRVKNNLQVICSLLNLQKSKHDNEVILNILNDSEHRVKSMALIHEKLYRSHDLSSIDISDYTRKLVTVLFRSFEGQNSRVKLDIKMEEFFLGVDQAVPLGLIINELASNALKHAFSNITNGELIIESNLINDNCFELVIKDNGKGLPENLDQIKSDSLGLQLVNTLTNQLDGKLEATSENGTRWVISFPVETRKCLENV